jgi:hypothetical protein
MAERDAQSLQIGLGRIAQDIEIDAIFGKDGCVLREPDSLKPSRYPVIDAHCRRLTNMRAGSPLALRASSSQAVNKRLESEAQLAEWPRSNANAGKGNRRTRPPNGRYFY